MAEMSANIPFADERAGLYGFFAALCLRPPTPEFVGLISNGSLLSEIKARPDSRGIQEMALFVKEAARISDLVNELTAEHARLFVLPADVIPQEAFYTDPKKRLGGAATAAVARLYETAGAEVLRQCIEMPDHIGIELQFMEFLCRLEAECDRKGDADKAYGCRRLQKQFLEAHLLRWAFECCEQIAKFAQFRFYKSVAFLLREFLEEEREAIGQQSS